MRESDLGGGSGHVVVTGAGGRYLNPLRERRKEMLHILTYNIIRVTLKDS